MNSHHGKKHIQLYLISRRYTPGSAYRCSMVRSIVSRRVPGLLNHLSPAPAPHSIVFVYLNANFTFIIFPLGILPVMHTAVLWCAA